MERLGLVGQLEAKLERSISLGLLPPDGKLPSERTLASHYGVEVRPGRRARAVVMEQAVRLENLGTALLGEGSSRPERQQMLAAYLELKREVTLELLAACCEQASEEELEKVRNACFLLGDAACWEMKRPSWVALEFELLRQAALAAQRPGHWLLIQTLEQACRSMAGRVEPYLDSPALYPWTQCAMEALCSKDVKEMRSRLPGLLQASDERVLQALAPSCEAYGFASFMGTQRQAPEVLTASQALLASDVAEVPQPAPSPMPAGGPGSLCAKWSGFHTTLRKVPPEGAPPVPDSAAPEPIPSTGALWPRSTEEDSWPRLARGREPGLT
jgi:GntR family transcriptional regulator, transcriptional repressor for pyruvate dehydrogenase complex